MRKGVSTIVSSIRFDSALQETVFKATKSKEEAPKRKHLRNIILNSWSSKHGNDFFSMLSASNRPVLSKVTVAYKVLIVVHKLMQEGHPSCLEDCYRQKHLQESLVKRWSGKVAYHQLVKSYSEFQLDKLAFHHNHHEWIHDKEGNLDQKYFFKKFPDGGDAEYCLETVGQVLDIQGSLLNMTHKVLLALKMDQRVSKVNTNACVAYALVPLITDSYSYYQVLILLLRRAHALNAEPDVLDSFVDRFDRHHDKLRSLYEECSGISYVAALVGIPNLPFDAPTFKRGRKKKKVVREPTPEPEPMPDLGTGKLVELEAIPQQQMNFTPIYIPPPVVVQQPTGPSPELLSQMTDKIKSERDQAARIFAHKDAQIEKWKEMSKKINQGNKDLQAQLEALLAANRALREKIRIEKEQHADRVHAFIQRHVSQARQAIESRVFQFDNPSYVGFQEATGSDVANNVEDLIANLDTVLSVVDGDDVPTLLKAVKSVVGPCRSLLANTKGVCLTLQPTNGKVVTETARGIAVDVESMLASISAEDVEGSKEAAEKLKALLLRMRAETAIMVQEEEKLQLTPAQVMEMHSNASNDLSNVSSRLRDALEKLKQQRVGDDCDEETKMVIEAMLDAASSITGATGGLVGGVMDAVQKSIDQYRVSPKKLFKRDAEWLMLLTDLAKEVAEAVDALVAVAMDIVLNHKEDAWSSLISASERVKDVTLKFVTHHKTKTSDAKSVKAIDGAYDQVSLAIAALIKAVASYQEHKASVEKLNARTEKFNEDRTKILAKRARVHRLKSQVHRKKISTTSLEDWLNSGGIPQRVTSSSPANDEK